MTNDVLKLPEGRAGATISFPEHVYVPVYGPGCGGTAYIAGFPPDDSWKQGEYGPNTAMIDKAVLDLLRKLFVGEITSWQEIQGMEYALRAMILHELVYWIQPGLLSVKSEPVIGPGNKPVADEHGQIWCPYTSTPDELKSLLKETRTQGYLPYFAYVHIEKDGSRWGHSYWVDNYDAIESASESEREALFQGAFAFENYRNQYLLTPACMGSASFFGRLEDKQIANALRDSGVAPLPEKVLNQLDDSWAEAMGAGIGLNVKVGPLLAVVLDRASSRDDLEQVILELRHEFQDARTQLWGMYENVIKEKRIKVAVREMGEITNSIKSIIPASFPQKTPVLNWFWNLTGIASELATLNLPAVFKNLGDLGLTANEDWKQVSVLETSKLLSSFIAEIEPAIPDLLTKHLTDSEKSNLSL